MLTGDPDNPVAPEALADVFETIESVTFSTHAHSDEESRGLPGEGDEQPPVTEGDGEELNSDDDTQLRSGLPTLVGADQFVSLVVDDENGALAAANTALVDRDTELTSAQGERDAFFVDGAGSDFDDLGQLQSVASDLRAAETEAQRLEGEVSGAQEARDGFFVDGAGSDFDDLGQLPVSCFRPSRCGD